MCVFKLIILFILRVIMMREEKNQTLIPIIVMYWDIFRARFTTMIINLSSPIIQPCSPLIKRFVWLSWKPHMWFIVSFRTNARRYNPRNSSSTSIRSIYKHKPRKIENKFWIESGRNERDCASVGPFSGQVDDSPWSPWRNTVSRFDPLPPPRFFISDNRPQRVERKTKTMSFFLRATFFQYVRWRITLFFFAGETHYPWPTTASSNTFFGRRTW